MSNVSVSIVATSPTQLTSSVYTLPLRLASRKIVPILGRTPWNRSSRGPVAMGLCVHLRRVAAEDGYAAASPVIRRESTLHLVGVEVSPVPTDSPIVSAVYCDGC